MTNKQKTSKNNRPIMNRRNSIKAMAASAMAIPGIFPRHGMAAPSDTIAHASFGGGGMAWADIQSFSQTKGFRLVAVADVDSSRFEEVTKAFPGVRVYQDWRILLDKEKDL